MYSSSALDRYSLVTMTSSIDALDARLIDELSTTPRAGVMELARRIGVARGTVQARLDRLVAQGVITGFGPAVDPVALGYEVLAFNTIEIAQGRLADVVDHLRDIPEVLEVQATTGQGDLHCRVVARSNAHLQQVINRILEVHGITRTSTVIATTTEIGYRVLPLAHEAAAVGGGGTGRATPRR